MPTTTTERDNIAAARKDAEAALATAKATADQLRVHHARIALHEAFPEQTLAIFARNANETDTYVIQLLSENTMIDLRGDDAYLTREQHQALELANIAIGEVGDDDELLKHLDAPDTEHDDWYEFHLTLHPQTEVTTTAS